MCFLCVSITFFVSFLCNTCVLFVCVCQSSSSVVDDLECEQRAEPAVRSSVRSGRRPCNAFTCGLAKMEVAFDIHSPYAEIVWSLSAYDAFEAVLGLELRRLLALRADDDGGGGAVAGGDGDGDARMTTTMGVEVLEAGPGVALSGGGGGVSVSVRAALYSSSDDDDTDTDLEAVLRQLTSDLSSASVDPLRFFDKDKEAPFFYYLKSIVPGTVSPGSVTRTRYCAGDRKCSNLNRGGCSGHVGWCGPCNDGFSVVVVGSGSGSGSSSSSTTAAAAAASTSEEALSTEDGLWQCFPDVDCAYATPHHCAANLFRQPCSRTANTCGPCLSGYDGVPGASNTVCTRQQQTADDCSMAPDCSRLHREECRSHSLSL
jgi:hypothetical protein